MKTTMLVSVLFFFGFVMHDETDVIGKWNLPENNTVIEIELTDGVLSGKVIESDIEEAIGKEVLKDFKKEGDIWNGSFYVVRRDRTVDAIIKELDDNTLEMEVNPGGRRSKTLGLTRAD
jgi:uncharacterized protein (DUF2147 family)